MNNSLKRSHESPQTQQQSQAQSSQKIRTIGDFKLLQTLGEGAYGKVKLAQNKVTGEVVAIKFITSKLPDPSVIKKELSIQRNLDHRHIVKLTRAMQVPDWMLLVCEYASGGELYDRILLDEGIEGGEPIARLYFKQLLEAVSYLHSKGIVHRDIKPENMLLDACGNLKLTDFGFATYFLNEEKKMRMLDKKCGSAPYVAPEVISAKLYHGPLVDIWSCGIVLAVLLSGMMPWDSPQVIYEEYQMWDKGVYTMAPWPNINPSALDLLKLVLACNPQSRVSIDYICKHPWTRLPINDSRVVNGLFVTPEKQEELASQMAITDIQRPLSADERKAGRIQRGNSFQASTCPMNTTNPFSSPHYKRQHFSYSQPTKREASDLVLQESETQQTQTQTNYTPENDSEDPLYGMRRRTTRIFSSLPVVMVEDKLKLIFNNMKLQWTYNPLNHSFKIEIREKNDEHVSFSVRSTVLSVECLNVDFRLIRGNSLAFKKQFKEIRKQFKAKEFKDVASSSTGLFK